MTSTMDLVFPFFLQSVNSTPIQPNGYTYIQADEKVVNNSQFRNQKYAFNSIKFTKAVYRKTITAETVHQRQKLPQNNSPIPILLL
jgi:hypothetical protein